MNILIVRVSAIGDVIHTLPAAFLIKACIPEARIHWIVQKKAASLLINQPLFDNVWVINDRYLAPHKLFQTYTIMQEIRSQSWDAILDFQGLFKTSLLLWPLRGKKYGFDWDNARESISSWWTNFHITPDYDNIIQKNLALASFFIHNTKKIITQPTIQTLQKSFHLHLSQEKKSLVERWIQEYTLGNIIALCPNTTWESKRWPQHHWQTLLKALHHQYPQINVVLIGKNFGHDAASLARFAQDNNLHLACTPDWDLITLSYFLQKIKLLIAPDTSFLHIADFLGTPAIGLFGPTSHKKHGAFIFQKNMQAALQASCPHIYQKHHASMVTQAQNCMELITPDNVLEKIKNFLV